MNPLLIRTKIMPYESLSSLTYRLTQANFYDRAGRINGLIDLPRRFGLNQDALNDQNVIKKLAFINNCSENEIINATVHRFMRYFSDGTPGSLSSSAVTNFVPSSNTKYCPLCLKKSGYHKIYWDLQPISICIEHGVILNEVCLKCRHPVKVNVLLGNKCKCGGDLLSVDPIYITSCEDVIRNQTYIQDRLDIYKPNDPEVAYWNYSPATKLSTPNFFKLLKLFSALILSKLPKSSKFLRPPVELLDQKIMKNDIPTLTNFIVMHSTVSILLDWPQKFYEFLDEYGTVDRSKRYDTGVQKYFGGFKESILDKLDIEKFGFIHHEYAKYLNEHWTGGHLNDSIKVFDMLEAKKLQKKYISADEAIDILGGRDSSISKLIGQKIIQAVVLKAKSKRKYLIDAESVYALKKKRDGMLMYSDLVDRFNIDADRVRLLVKNGLLSPFKSPVKFKITLFLPEDVKKFEKEFLSEERHSVVNKKPEGYLPATEAVKTVTSTKTNLVGLLQLVRQGVFNPIICTEEKGLSRLLFSKNELIKYRDAFFDKKRDKNKISVHRAGIILGIDMRYVRHLINVGLIPPMVENVNGKQTTCILKKDLDDFKSEYAFIEEAAELIGFNIETVFQWIKQGRIKDHSGIPLTKRSSIRVLRREEIKPLTPENSMDIPQAAEYLGLSSHDVYILIRKNLLTTLKGKGAGKTPFNRIPIEEIVRYREDLLKPTQENYMSVGQAAKYLGVGRSTIYRLRNKKILSTTNHKCKRATLIPLHELEDYKRRNLLKCEKKRNRTGHISQSTTQEQLLIL